ncbi:unnamed protein product [Psylliodes chrysocephalus]|uniref:Uncharacterized protein n=1 Tax=Psylliodes chrysocephalus TaxID=3402493 RepID=A0A9P0CQ06_9CUCU|nr:unnamed protein product [Psylliodes chrysocephala]
MLRKEASIKYKEQYHALYKELGKMGVLGVDWMFYNIKGLEEIYRKFPGTSAIKKIHLKLMTDIFQSLGKRGRSSKNYEFEQLPLVRHLPPEKVTNVKSLLKAEFNDDWRADPELAWYKIIIDSNIENAT